MGLGKRYSLSCLNLNTELQRFEAGEQLVTEFTQKQRQHWMSVLSKSKSTDVIEAWNQLNFAVDFDFLRQPEIGLVMARGRVGGTGDPFNIGEITVTRCSVKTEQGQIGHAYIAGRDKQHATIAALIDALLQSPERQVLEEKIIQPLHTQLTQVRESHARKAAATKVDFFTVARSSTPI